MNGKSKIIIGKAVLGKLSNLIHLKKYSKVLLIIDRGVGNHQIKKIEEIVSDACGKIVVQGGEQAKNIATTKKIWTGLLNFNCDRKSLVVNFGGGTIGDVGGFAASTFKRGIDFIQVPTTLLAQADASIGGKVGINFAGIKNLIGSIQQPTAVIADINILSTLPPRELISGFAEIIKHGVIADKIYFQFVTSKKPQQFSSDELVKIVKGSYQIKSKIVSSDETEEGPRKLLNFGHTIGHSLEALTQDTNNQLLHGEAVSIGMAKEGQISKLIGILSEQDYHILEQALTRAGLPTKIPNLPKNQILEKIKSDKKNEKGEINWTLIKGIGKALYDQKVDDAIVREVL